MELDFREVEFKNAAIGLKNVTIGLKNVTTGPKKNHYRAPRTKRLHLQKILQKNVAIGP